MLAVVLVSFSGILQNFVGAQLWFLVINIFSYLELALSHDKKVVTRLAFLKEIASSLGIQVFKFSHNLFELCILEVLKSWKLLQIFQLLFAQDLILTRQQTVVLHPRYLKEVRVTLCPSRGYTRVIFTHNAKFAKVVSGLKGGYNDFMRLSCYVKVKLKILHVNCAVVVSYDIDSPKDIAVCRRCLEVRASGVLLF